MICEHQFAHRVFEFAAIYGIAKSAVRIASGETARTKRVEIPDGSIPRQS